MSLSLAPPEISPKRRAILDAAAELFMKEGFGPVSMDAVARGAQVSKATLYAHFTGKDALFQEIIEESCQKMQALVPQALANHAQPLEAALAELGAHWLGFLLRPRVRALHRVVVAEGARVPELAQAFYTAGPVTLRGWLLDWLAGEAARGRLQPDAPLPLVAEQFFSLLRGDLFLRATLGLSGPIGEEEVRTLAEAAARAIARLYGAPPA
ncbi:TetR/AcrR family transcriptional regulator [Roseomonas sp. 18066]|uniref:TetR/AcrR family transcriptional regulator n=1 Tax=Roseomonas sp. 18066 TaxID=2681412 RepID=UPI00135A785B|nr:TetR/AcrR family transcriptional regulator [Roseomonas sp. 18066]